MRSQYLSVLFAGLVMISCAENDEPIDKTEDIIAFENPQEVQIDGYADHAMEPFISPDGQHLFFNSLNDAINTKLYYATRVDDLTFTFVGEVNGANQTVEPYLDAVADMDELNNFYWTSTREYPAKLNNLHHGQFSNGSVNNIGRVSGDFYNTSPGWILMDHGISIDGELLFYNNAMFDGSNCNGPCETYLGIAQKVSASEFNKVANSDEILAEINDSDYKYYAPVITSDNLELYYTRFPQGNITASTQAEICVATRTSSTGVFSKPIVLFSDDLITDFVEAPTLTTDKQIMYYHKKVDGTFKIMLRYRQ